MTPDFGHYASWHRDWFRQSRQKVELAYWRRRLRGLEPLTLPTDRPRTPQQSFRGRRLHRPLDPALTSRLQRIAASDGATLAMLLLAALKLLLHVHTNRMDIAVGVPVANRQHAGGTDVVGTLVNTLVIRSDLSACNDSLDVLALVRRNLLEALDHQDLPFEQLVQALGVQRDAASSPLFTVMFNMLNTPLGEVCFRELAWSRFEFDRGAAQFDLTVTIDAEFDRSIVFEYATDLFDAETIAGIADRYFHLLGRLAEQPRQPLTAELWLPDQERAQLKAWGTGASRAIQPAALLTMVEQALQNSQGMGLRWQGEDMDCATLERRSAAIAGALQGLGIGPGQRVGICLPRCPAMLVATLGVIRTGAAFVPLDPHYPAERLVFMANDAALSALVATRETAGQHPWPNTPRVLLEAWGILVSSADDEDASRYGLRHSDVSIGGDDPAYVIYTSGSSGDPKGVLVRQASVANFLLAMAERPGLAHEDRLLAVTTPSFDISVLEFLLPLWTGATLILASEKDIVDGAQLAGLMLDEHVTAMQATPSTWRMLLEAGWRGQPALKALVGGEPLSPTLAYQLAQRAREVWNMYGPTETTVWSSCWQLPPRHEGVISLGTPILNTSFQVVDSRLQPCPVGVPGELLIGGTGVAIGYLANPALTAERFLKFPETETTMYRTGDLVRWTSDGSLEHLGRLDHQVKLRGHRIELGEIENRLGQHPAIAGTVAVAVEDAPGDGRLVAYVVPWQQLPPATELREYLRRWLPDYMLPQRFVELDAIPLLPNGKVDRASLPAATPERVVTKQGEHKHATPLETALHGLWCEVLALDTCSVTESFFELGGHSMLAVRLARLIRERLGYSCHVATLFRHPSIRRLAETLQAAADVVTNTLVALQPLGNRDPIFCLCGVSLYARLAEALPLDRPVYGMVTERELALQNPYNTSLPTVEELATQYLALIHARQPEGPVHLVGFSLGSSVALELANRLSAAGQPVGALVLLDGDAPGQAGRSIAFRLKRVLKSIGSDLVSSALRSDTRSETAEAAVPDSPFIDAIQAYQPSRYSGRAAFVEARGSGRQSSKGWSGLVGELEVHGLPADHLGLLRDSTVDRVAVIVAAELAHFEAGRT